MALPPGAAPWQRRTATLSAHLARCDAAGAAQPPAVRLSAEVAAALAAHRPVVALESTIISHGMPFPANLATAREVEAVVRAAGAVPATVAVMDGQPCVGALTRSHPAHERAAADALYAHARPR